MLENKLISNSNKFYYFIKRSYRDGPASDSSPRKKRTNQEIFERRKTGSKPDMSIRIISGGRKPLDFGACEAAAYYDGPTDRKYFYKSTIKLPKILKDVLFDLCKYVDWDKQKIKQIGVEGCIQSGKYLKPHLNFTTNYQS